MKAIRGATTLSCDTAEEVRTATRELLQSIAKINGLKNDEIVCMMFSSTADIKSLYPATAAREAGFSDCALYSSLEPDISGSLAMCIRVMVLADIDRKVKYVYLRGAKSLRKDLSDVINIALDGPAGSGKSTVSKLVAKKLDILSLDTGAMYRAVALKCINEGVDYSEKSQVDRVVENIDLRVEYGNGGQLTLLDGKDVSGDIRTSQVSMLASYVSAYPSVRAKMVSLQREIASHVSCILDGRDIGTNVLPDCLYKFFLTASPEVRAERRFKEDKLKGSTQTYEDILLEINERDAQDRNRAVAPLKCADDAVVIDTSEMTAEEVANTICERIQEKI